MVEQQPLRVEYVCEWRKVKVTQLVGVIAACFLQWFDQMVGGRKDTCPVKQPVPLRGFLLEQAEEEAASRNKLTQV